MLTSWLGDDLTTKHCGQKIRACHTVSLVLGILAALLFVSNVVTIVYVNRRPILRFCRRMIGITYEDDDMRRSIINTD
ncbi:hypothetical protein ANCCEY_05470 [Ancylostoma ceylanicum]|uniref:Uncharacterized protein n=2 Tax=Ancylostoma ceylanicum TaxID=53326 RepID=A0A016UZL5_9BILA|nr:hypothetical protein ANCCEY_05470 [Ancylostoma ceylanicum]EYC20590.1 hypothetical protein Y032_0021g295 [Ancylostoma ceylanicum]